MAAGPVALGPARVAVEAGRLQPGQPETSWINCDNQDNDVLADAYSFTVTYRPPYHWLRGT